MLLRSPITPLLLLLLASFLMSGIVVAQTENTLSQFSDLSESDVRNSIIAFVNTTSSPGLEGATLSVNSEERNSDQFRSSLGFNAEVVLKNHLFDAYWGFGIVGGSLDDRIRLAANSGEPVLVALKRKINSVRGSLGLVLPVNEHFKLRPVLTIAVSDLRTSYIIDGILDEDGNPGVIKSNNNAQIGSATGSIDALYWYWHDDYKLELSAHYNVIYSDSFSEDHPVLNTQEWNSTAQLRSRISGPTPLITKARPWRWQAYVNHTNFISQQERALGYTSLFEIGGGLEWRLNAKPLDWFGWQYIGFNAGVITSTNVEGYNIGVTAR